MSGDGDERVGTIYPVGDLFIKDEIDRYNREKFGV